MAEGIEELRTFFMNLNTLFGQISQAFLNKDTIGAEHCKSKLEDYISIVVAITTRTLKITTGTALSKRSSRCDFHLY